MPPSLYETDILAWSEQQAALLRRLAAGERVNDVDWTNLIEEVEAVGRSELNTVRSNLRLALLHALKLVAWPSHPARDHWAGEVTTFLVNARTRFEPGMRQRLELDRLYADALRDFARLDMPPAHHPVAEDPALDPADLLEDGFGARDLVAALTPR